MPDLTINATRLLQRVEELGRIGIDAEGRRSRLAGSDADKLGRGAFVAWATDAGLTVRIDRIGNIFGIWGELTQDGPAPILMGSHIDTVIDAGAFDGCYGVLAALEVIQTLQKAGVQSNVPLVVAAFTNEEGVRFAPDMMGSAVFAGTLGLDEALSAVGTDGTVLGEELARIGYAGTEPPGFFAPQAYLELHIEQGPILEAEGIQIGAVEGVQGISWSRVTIEGQANHAGTTPMGLRRDAGVAAARLITALDDFARSSAEGLVVTVGCIEVIPNAINVVPGKAVLTVDMRSPYSEALRLAETRMEVQLNDLAGFAGCNVQVERLARTEPVPFDQILVEHVTRACGKRRLSSKRMVSGAGHDAQMLAPITPTAMIFVPSANGISHNPLEHTEGDQLAAGVNVLLDVVMSLLSKLRLAKA